MSRILICTLLIISASLSAQQDNGGEYATMSFVEKEYQFGVIERGEVVQNVYEFTNTSTVPLVIESARGNCGCTVPEYPLEPILPGETSQLLIYFDSGSKVGSQNKSVLISANTDPMITILKVKGMVLRDPDWQPSITKSSLEDIEADKFDVSLNTETSTLSIDLKGYGDDLASIQVFNLKGQLSLSEAEVPLLGIKDIDVSELAAGIYVVSAKLPGKNRITRQFVIP